MQSAALLVFPIDRQTALVRRTARTLADLHGEAANSFWRSAARDLHRELIADGHDDLSARQEVGRFSDCVQTEMRQLTTSTRSLVTA